LANHVLAANISVAKAAIIFVIVTGFFERMNNQSTYTNDEPHVILGHKGRLYYCMYKHFSDQALDAMFFYIAEWLLK